MVIRLISDPGDEDYVPMWGVVMRKRTSDIEHDMHLCAIDCGGMGVATHFWFKSENERAYFLTIARLRWL